MLKLREYQEEAADFLYEHDKAMMLAPVGAGKTATALIAMQDAIRDGVVKRWLVIAPKRVCTDVWPEECKKWTPELKLTVAVGTPEQRRQAIATKSHICVVNYDNLQTFHFGGFDGIVFDELTKLKNPSGKRFKALEKSIDHVQVRWGLTGSFTSNGLEDVYGQCRIVDRLLLGRSKGAFMQQYFIMINPQFGEWIPRRGALQMVMDKIKPATYLLENVEYKDILPPLNIVPQYVELPDRKVYEEMRRNLMTQIGEEKITAINAGVVTSKLQQIASGFVYSTTSTASATPGKWDVKREAYKLSDHKFERLDDLLEENQRANTIIVYNFQEELEELKRRYPHAVGLDDNEAVKKWNAGDVELLLLHPKSAGHGLNLQFGGCRLVFLSLPWSLELFEQTVGRLHRSGQRHAVWVYPILTSRTIDERIYSALHDKKSLAEIAYDALK